MGQQPTAGFASERWGGGAIQAAQVAGCMRGLAHACRVVAAVSITCDTCASQGQDPKQPEVSPLRTPDVSGLAPALILTAEVDALRDEAEQYAARLSATGVKTRLKRFQAHWHNSMLQDTVFADPAQLCYGDVAAFLQDVFFGNI